MDAPLKGTTMHSNVVMIGGGVFGTSTAYHLARKGGRNIAPLEAREVGSQTASQAAGLIRSRRGSHVGAQMALYPITPPGSPSLAARRRKRYTKGCSQTTAT